MKKLLFLIPLLLFTSCITKKNCSKKFPLNETKDSSYIETVKIVPVVLPGFSHNINVPIIDCSDQLLARIENSKLRQEISILNGRLYSNTEVKPDTIKVPVIETKIEYKEVKSDPQKYIPKVYKFYARFFYWISSILLLFGLYKSRYFLIKILTKI